MGELLPLWAETLAKEDPVEQALLYANQSILLPTLSNEPATDFASKVDYFTDFMARHPRVISVDESFLRWASTAHDTAINSGLATLETTDKTTGAKSTVYVRFTFVYQKQEDGTWKIIEHHNSMMPEPVQPAV